LEVISYTDLLSIWKRGMRNGAFRRLPLLKRGLFRAALCYTRMIGRIINPRLVEMIKGVADRIGKGLGRRILERGMERALGFLKGRVCRIFPAVRRWIDDNGYILWLGTDILVRRSWIVIAR